jgi:hypothetical protein
MANSPDRFPDMIDAKYRDALEWFAAFIKRKTQKKD